MEILILAAPPIIAGALTAVAVSSLCYGLVSAARLFAHGPTVAVAIVMIVLSMTPIGTYLWLDSLDLDGGEGVTAFLIAVFFCASACFSMAFLTGMLLDRRSRLRRRVIRRKGS